MNAHPPSSSHTKRLFKRVLRAPLAWGIRTQMATCAMLLFFLTLCILFMAASSSFQNVFLKATEERERVLAESLRTELDAKLLLYLELLSEAAKKTPSDVFENPAHAQAFLNQTPLRSAFDNGLSFVGEDGFVLAETPLPYSSGSLKIGRKVQNKVFFEAVFRANSPLVSNGFSSERCGDCPVIDIAVPVYNNNDHRVGFLYGSLKLHGETFLAALEALKVGESGAVHLIDARHSVLLNTDQPSQVLKNAKTHQQLLHVALTQHQSVTGIFKPILEQPQILSFMPLKQAAWVVVVHYPLSQALAPFDTAKHAFIFSGVLSSLLLLYVLWSLLSRFSRPLERLSLWAEKADIHHPTSLALKESSELHHLSQSLHSLLTRAVMNEDNLLVMTTHLEERVKERTYELEQTLIHLENARDSAVQREKLAALGTLLSGVAGELSSPISTALSASHLLANYSKQLSPLLLSSKISKSALLQLSAQVENSALTVEQSMSRASALVKSFKQVAFDQSHDELRCFDLAQTLSENITTLMPLLKGTPFTLQFISPDSLWVRSYPGAFGQIISQFVNNSLQHAFEGRTSGLMQFELQENDTHLSLTYSDDGVGIETALQSRIFEAFFTTKRGFGGFGLGLHIIHTLATDQLGSLIRFHSKPGEGCQFTLCWQKEKIRVDEDMIFIVSK